jgi:hypothetical protein
MDAFEEGIRRLQGDLDNLRQLVPRIGDGEIQLPPPFNPNLGIAGAEVTQGIQYYAQGSGGGVANSVRLVENKTTVLRVELDVTNRNQNLPLPATVTGEITYPGVELGSPESRPINGPLVARPGGQFDRGNADHTLNFRVQGWRCTGSFYPRVRLFDPANPGGGPQSRDPRFTGRWSQPAQLTFPRLRIPFVEREITDYRLRLVCVRIGYVGPNQNGAPTVMGPVSDAEVFSTLSDSFVTRTFPVSGINYIDTPMYEFAGDLRLGQEWDRLLRELQNMRSAATSNDVYLGLLPNGVPNPGDRTGQSDLNRAAVAVADQNVVAHELAHAYGRQHVPCGDPVGIDPFYPPPCGTLPAGSICEFGFSTKLSTVFNPNNTVDLLPARNCPIPTQWISPYTFRGLFFAIHYPLPFPGIAAAVDREYLYLNFRMHRNGTVDLLPSFHLAGLVPEADNGPPSPVAFELRDTEKQIIGFYRCRLTDPHADPDDGPYYDFHKLVPWETETRSIGFLRDGEEVAEVEVEEKEPEITTKPVTKPVDRENRMRLEWEAKNDTKPLTYLVRYSNDGGENWLGLAAGLTKPSFEVDLDSLPGGERCVFQVGASSTVRTKVEETMPVSVPVKPRRPYIVSPEPGATFLQEEPVSLAGVGYSPDFETTPLDEAAWSSNVAGFIGYGYEIITETLAPGPHKITLSVADGLGGEASADVRIRIKPKEE